MNAVKAGRARRDRRDKPEDNDLLTGSSYERACPQCGKLFLCFNVNEWVYRRNEYKVFCSWTCYREDQRGVPPHGKAAEKLPKTPKKNNTRFNQEQAREQTRQIIELKNQGKTNEECGIALGLTVFQVANRLQTSAGSWGGNPGQNPRRPWPAWRPGGKSTGTGNSKAKSPAAAGSDHGRRNQRRTRSRWRWASSQVQSGWTLAYSRSRASARAKAAW